MHHVATLISIPAVLAVNHRLALMFTSFYFFISFLSIIPSILLVCVCIMYDKLCPRVHANNLLSYGHFIVVASCLN